MVKVVVVPSALRVALVCFCCSSRVDRMSKLKKGKGKKAKKPTPPVSAEPEFVFAAEPGDKVLAPSSKPWPVEEGEDSAPAARRLLPPPVPPVHPVYPGVFEAEEELDRLRNEITGNTGSVLLAAVSL